MNNLPADDRGADDGEKLHQTEEGADDSAGFTRRRAVIALTTAIPSLAMAGSATKGSGKNVSQKPTIMMIECPKDGIVAKVNWTSQEIKAGSVICEIDPDDEDRALDRIELANQLLLLEANLLDPKNVAVRRSILEQGVEAAATNEQLCTVIYNDRADAKKLSLIDAGGLAPYQIALARAKAEHAKALASLTLFDFNIAQARKRLQLYTQQIPEEKAFVTKRLERLKISAPADGVITVLVGANAFVKKGHLVATLEVKGIQNGV